MKLAVHLYLILFFVPISTLFSQHLADDYLAEWKLFHPSKAVQKGMHGSVFASEDRSQKAIAAWVALNEGVLKRLSEDPVEVDAMDARLLRVQAQSELDQWKSLSLHTTSLTLYARLIKNALPTLFSAEYLLLPEKKALVCQRLQAMQQWAAQAEENLAMVNKEDLDKGLKALSETMDHLQNDLKADMQKHGLNPPCPEFDVQVQLALRQISKLQSFGTNTLEPKATPAAQVLGPKEYARRLALYTDTYLAPDTLAAMALAEIDTVKNLMATVSRSYLMDTYPTNDLAKTKAENIQRALMDMERDAPQNAADYLAFWEDLAAAAVAFIQEKDLATLPKNNTLQIKTAPESAGPAARIGWVASAPPFDLNPMTTLYLPSIPDTLPQQEQIDFWASFNKPFNRIIVIHELYPGHYMQLKIARETPHPVRLLFPFGPYIEGWATFTEKVVLDAGWEAGNQLTLLAHLRKRLENANRAYTSVQVHCHGWTEEQVMQFSTETSLLAPQFAKSLWGRIMTSPLQLTSYYWGSAQFRSLLEREKERLGPSFDLKFFMDTILKAGPIPIDGFHEIFENSKPKP